jgi:hypothetical protein
MIEVLKQAVDWAEKHGEVVFAGGGMRAIEPMNDWVQAGRQAIAELESQEPVKYEHKAYTMPPQPEQKTSADDFFKTIADKNPKPFPPSQRTWVGLTFREQQEAILNTHSIHEALIKAEAKLKERNYEN